METMNRKLLFLLKVLGSAWVILGACVLSIDTICWSA
jgi:hypothetical protein